MKIVCSPNSLEALKVGVLNAKFVPLSVLGSFALQKKEKKKKTAGKILFNQQGFEEKTTGAN